MIKSGIDYFPLDVSMDAKMELIEAEFGLPFMGKRRPPGGQGVATASPVMTAGEGMMQNAMPIV